MTPAQGKKTSVRKKPNTHCSEPDFRSCAFICGHDVKEQPDSDMTKNMSKYTYFEVFQVSRALMTLD